ncbi:MAG: DNA-binding response regulator [Rhodospirillales bacterium]|nr:MAG: DNA-binding response regulator [Rhodospirillales bacterium]
MRVLIADDHPLFREALSSVVAEMSADAVCLDAASFDDAFAAVRDVPDLDLILLDLTMPGAEGLTGLGLLRHAAPAIPVVVVSATAERRTVLEALRAGAVGYLPKSASRATMITALKMVLAGGVYVPGDVVRGGNALDDFAADGRIGPAGLATLTRKQLQVLEHLARGLSNKEIARALSLAEPTVKTHVSALLRKLHLRSRTQAIVAAGSVDFSRLRRPEPATVQPARGDE